MPNQNSYGSQSFADILDLAVGRLVAGVTGASSRNVRTAMVPDTVLFGPDYIAEEGIILRVLPPDPQPMAGAGRNGYITERRIDTVITTQNLRDPGGRDDVHVRTHLRREEQVLNVLTLDPPADLPYGAHVSYLIKFVPGGAELARRIQTNPGMAVSVLSFVVTYVPPMVVNRVP